MSKTKTEIYVVECAECGRFYTARGINTHIKNHNKKKSLSVYKSPNQKSYKVPDGGNIDVDELSEMDFGSDEEVNVLGMDFTNLSIDDARNDNNAIVPAAQQVLASGKETKKKRLQPEQAIQLKMEKKLGGGHVTTPAGIIDILTPTMLVELKNWNDWIKAVGQVLVYGHFYPNHMKRIHFFGNPPSQDKQIVIKTICTSYGIAVSSEK